MIKPKLPPYFIGRIMNIADNLINQIRQTPSISGCHACNLPLIKSSQRGGGPSNGHKRAHNQISTSESTAQISTSSLRKANSLIKELYNRLPKWLQPNPEVSQQNIRSKTATEIGNHPRKRMVFLFDKTNLHLAKYLA